MNLRLSVTQRGHSCTCSVTVWPSLQRRVKPTQGCRGDAVWCLFVCLFQTVNKTTLHWASVVFQICVPVVRFVLLSAADLESANGQCSKCHCYIHYEELTYRELWVRGEWGVRRGETGWRQSLTGRFLRLQDSRGATLQTDRSNNLFFFSQLK